MKHKVYSSWHRSKIFWKQNILYILGGLVGLFFILVIGQAIVLFHLSNMSVQQFPFPNFSFSPYPVMSAQNFPHISAEGAIVIDDTSQVVLYKKNSTLRFAPASTTKIMTALLALNTYPLTKSLIFKHSINTQGSGLGLQPGDMLTSEQTLYSALLLSANDAAYMVAQNYPGGTESFMRYMNEEAHKLSLLNTHFADPAGLHDMEDYTTPADLIRLTAFAMKHPVFAQIVGTTHKTITSLDGNKIFQLRNRNILLGNMGVVGVKTGYTEEAGEVLATAADIHGHRYYIVVMKSKDRFADTATLLNSIASHVQYKKF